MDFHSFNWFKNWKLESGAKLSQRQAKRLALLTKEWCRGSSKSGTLDNWRSDPTILLGSLPFQSEAEFVRHCLDPRNISNDTRSSRSIAEIARRRVFLILLYEIVCDEIQQVKRIRHRSRVKYLSVAIRNIVNRACKDSTSLSQDVSRYTRLRRYGERWSSLSRVEWVLTSFGTSSNQFERARIENFEIHALTAYGDNIFDQTYKESLRTTFQTIKHYIKQKIQSGSHLSTSIQEQHCRDSLATLTIQTQAQIHNETGIYLTPKKDNNYAPIHLDQAVTKPPIDYPCSTPPSSATSDQCGSMVFVSGPQSSVDTDTDNLSQRDYTAFPSGLHFPVDTDNITQQTTSYSWPIDPDDDYTAFPSALHFPVDTNNITQHTTSYSWPIDPDDDYTAFPSALHFPVDTNNITQHTTSYSWPIDPDDDYTAFPSALHFPVDTNNITQHTTTCSWSIDPDPDDDYTAFPSALHFPVDTDNLPQAAMQCFTVDYS